MVVVIVVDDGAVAGSILVFFFRCFCCWLLMVGHVCVMRVWKSLYNSFMVLFTSFVQHFDTTEPNSRTVSSCVPFMSFFFPVCADGLLHHTVQFIYIHMLTRSFTRKKRATTTPGTLNAMQCICFRGFGQRACPFFVLYMDTYVIPLLRTAAEHNFLLQFFFIRYYSHFIYLLWFIFWLLLNRVRAKITRRKDKNETKWRRWWKLDMSTKYVLIKRNTLVQQIPTHFKPMAMSSRD